MRVIVYSTQLFEKEYFATANQKKHDITLISNALTIHTVDFAKGKDSIVVFTGDLVSAEIIKKLKEYKVKLIITRSVGKDHIDLTAAKNAGIQVANIPVYSPESTAEHAIMLILALNRKLIKANRAVSKFDFRLDGLEGFTMKGKTVGIIGLGNIGSAVGLILRSFGCRIIGFDLIETEMNSIIERVSLKELYKQSDIISLHAPLTESTRHMINTQSLSLMKNTVMIINTARGGLVDTKTVIDALEFENIGYYGADVFELEEGLFFKNHEDDIERDPLLSCLINQPNVIITPHQGFLTHEALKAIASETVKKLDDWHEQDDDMLKEQISAEI